MSENNPRSAPIPEKTGWKPIHWIALYATFFFVFQIGIFYVVSQGGESRAQKQMLDDAKNFTENGEFADALKTLEKFGEKWPGAYNTQNFNRRLGMLHIELGEYETAEKFLKISIEKNAQIPGGWVQQGIAVWKQDRHEEAAALFQEELRRGDKRSDIAFAYLGLYFYEQENYPQAFEYFASVRDESAVDIDIAKYRKEFRETYLSEVQ